MSRRRLRKVRSIPYFLQTVDQPADRLLVEEAKEQETCEVVYFTWLLKSIKQGRPLSAERYRVWRERDVRGPDTEGNKIKTVGKGSKKRKLEYDMEHEVQDTWSRRLEEWAIMASLVSLVDPSFIAQGTSGSLVFFVFPV